MAKLVDLFASKYGRLTMGVPILEVGEYEVKKFVILENENYMQFLYLDTDKGLFKTASRNLIMSITWGLGNLMQEQFNKGETVLVEVVNQRKKTGKYGLSFRTV